MALGLYELINNINKQIKGICCKIENLDPGGGGGTNIYNSDGTLTGNRTLNGGNNELNFVNLAQFYGTNASTYQFEFDQNGVLFYDGSGEIRIDRNSDTTFIGNPSIPNRYGIIVDNANPLIKTIYQNNDIGLKLDFANDVYLFGNPGVTINDSFILLDNANGSFIQDPKDIKIGDGTNVQNFTYLSISDGNNEISTFNGGNQIGLKLDFANAQYEFGQLTGGNQTTLIIDDGNNVFYTRNNGSDLGILFNFQSTIYKFGQLTGGNATYLTIDDTAAYPVELTGTNISSGTAGAASGQFLKIKVGGVDYKIALLNP